MKLTVQRILIVILVICSTTMMMAGCSSSVYPSDSTKASKQWCFPLSGAKVISPFGKRGGRLHSGVDIKTKDKDNIYAAFDGEVIFSGKIRLNGKAQNPAKYFNFTNYTLKKR